MEAYEVGKRIGRGNYGSVYVARDRRNQRWYCLKMILMEAHSEEERGERERASALLVSSDLPTHLRQPLSRAVWRVRGV